ncbi:hypothetical protein FRC08_003535 [Ceratobasidium sp. 394]|nr:hypothetical protein FRC08_003535 [Ceratobasidium sp. 394]
MEVLEPTAGFALSDGLVVRSARGTPLFDSSPPDYFMWMTTFYSGSLVDISITPSNSDAPPVISYRTASLVLKSLMQHCPKIQRLSLLPNRELNSHYKNRETTILACLPVDPFYRYMNAATSLRHLTGTFAWFLEEPLLVLGRLPNLERIDICSGSDIPFKHMGSLLPAGSFSALRRLNMNTSLFDHVSTVMNTKHLVGRLEALNIVFGHAKLQFHGIESAKDDRFQKLFANTPCLRELFLAIDSREGLFLFDNTMLRILAEFPLQSVSLSGISFDEGARLEDLGNIWPKVTRLRMPDHNSTLAELSAFTRMPNLCHLLLRLQFCSPTAPDSLDGYVSAAPLGELHSSVRGRMCANPEELDVIEQ